MKKQALAINGIPAIIWGEDSSKVFIAVHGNMSHKEDTVIELLANEAVAKGYQVLSFDLPGHGARSKEELPNNVTPYLANLKSILNESKKRWNEQQLFSCSIGAYFCLRAYQNESFQQVFFLSPVVDMLSLLENMMSWFQVTPALLQQEKQIETPIGETLYWDYYCDVKENPICHWENQTNILYGSSDELCKLETIECFVKTFDAQLQIVENGEHFFHTKEQLNVYREWLESLL